MNQPAIAGLRMASAAAQIRYTGRDDLLLMELAEGTTIAATFTQNAFCAAPVTLAKQHLAAAPTRYLLINAGNANAGTGKKGMAAAVQTCQLVADASGCQPEQVLPFSTGVIGELLPTEPFRRALPSLLSGLSADDWPRAAQTIMTTDTVPKLAMREVLISESETVHLTGIAKGSGMIRPDMATMLAYIATDAKVDQGLLQKTLSKAVHGSFNAITVDSDTSTNDACVLMATGASPAEPLKATEDPRYPAFAAAVQSICEELAQAIIRDAEGASRFITITVNGARDEAEAREVAFTVAHSPLVKTALSAGDPNWGRILAAVGRADVADIDVNAIKIQLADVLIVENGGRADSYTEEAGQAALKGSDQDIHIDLGRGDNGTTVWTSDLSCEYVRINADYRS